MDLNKFSSFYSGLLYDTLRFELKYKKPFVLEGDIKPLWNFKCPIFGRAFTCKGQKIRYPHFVIDDIRLDMLSNLKSDTILIYDTGSNVTSATFGDITALIAKLSGCKGAIFDGCTRDINAITNLQFPVFGKGTIPVDSYGHWQVEYYNKEIYMKGIDGIICVSPNDYIFGDKDGILIIPNKLINPLYKAAIEKSKKEEELRKAIKNSLSSINLIKEYTKRGIH